MKRQIYAKWVSVPLVIHKNSVSSTVFVSFALSVIMFPAHSTSSKQPVITNYNEEHDESLGEGYSS